MKRRGLVSRLALTALLVLLSVRPAAAHLGTLNSIFEGLAGNIPVRVTIRPPGVVPGLAEISVRVLTNGVEKVSVLPVHWRAGLEGAPPPDVCRPVEGEPGLFHAQLWLMTTGAYSVHVKVETSHGVGRVIVPVNSLATTRLGLSPFLTGILAGLGLLLFFLAISVVGGAVRDSVLEPGQSASPRGRWIGRGATVGAGLLLGLALWGGKSWWDIVDRDYRNNRMFQPVPVLATVHGTADSPFLRLTVDEKRAGRNWGPLVPDHGKLMHLFLARETIAGADPDAFAHLHPVRRSSARFESALPALPAGRYRVFADVTDENGFAQTLATSVDLTDSRLPTTQQGGAVAAVAAASSTGSGQAPPATPAAPAAATELGTSGTPDGTVEDPKAPTPDIDDSWWTGSPESSGAWAAGGERQQAVAGGLTVAWENPGAAALRVGRTATLRFRVRDAAGQAVQLEPYMGMLSHLIVVRDDGAVFTHLHPAGSISLASQQVFQLRAGDRPPKRITAAMMEKLCQPPGPEMLQQPISFPYEFPKAGRYTLWIQFKAGGVVRTAAFVCEAT
jgi:hypothetical protein